MRLRQPGTICFEQRLSGALALNPHLHVQGLFARPPAPHCAAAFLPLPLPDDDEVEALARYGARGAVTLSRLTRGTMAGWPTG